MHSHPQPRLRRLGRLPGPRFVWLLAAAGALGWVIWSAPPQSEGHGHGTAALWLGLAGIILGGKAAGEVALRLKQPAVLGELLAGVLLGNLDLFGVSTFRMLAETDAVIVLADLGVILLLFQAGLETSIARMRKVIGSAGRVALLGMITPLVLGVAVATALMSEASLAHHLFVGATLTATSIGISARLLRDRNALDTSVGRIVLGAAAIDDVLGLMVLALVSGLVAGDTVPQVALLKSFAAPAAFLVMAAAAGVFLMPRLFFLASRLMVDDGWLAALAVGVCLAFSGLAGAVGLAPIVGAFAAGLLLDDYEMRPFRHRHVDELALLVAPVVTLLSPIFFARIGMAVRLDALSPFVLLGAAALTVAAVAGKLVAGFGVTRGTADRLTVGVAMIPRGEVGLIFADQGARLLDGKSPLLDEPTYTSVVLMVIATTLIAPTWLGRRLDREAGRANLAEDRQPEPKAGA